MKMERNFGTRNPLFEAFDARKMDEYRQLGEENNDTAFLGLLTTLSEQTGLKSSNSTDRHVTKPGQLSLDQLKVKIATRYFELRNGKK